MNISKIYKYTLKIFLIIYAIFSVCIFIAPLKYGTSIKFILFYVIILLLFLFLILLKKHFKNILKNKKVRKIIFISIIVIGILLRIIFAFLNYNQLPEEGDYYTFFFNASNFCEKGFIYNKSYVELFPFLIPYMVILGSFFKLTKISYNCLVILNIILDLLIPLFLYFTFENKNVKKAIVSFWLLSPINLVWCTVCCPVVLVNFGIALSLLVFSKILKHINSKLFILYSILTGVIMGIANMFRPLMLIMLIAIALYYIFINLNQKKLNTYYIISLLLIFISFISISFLGRFTLNKIIDGKVSTSSGWTLYIGSNIESSGGWYSEPKFEEFSEKYSTAEEIQQEFKKLAIERYKNNGIKNINLFISKFFVITGNIAEYSFETFKGTVSISNNLFLNLIKLAFHIYITILILLNALNVYLDIKYKNSDIQDLFYMLLYIGLVMAHLFVEVSPRYYMPAIVPLTIISGLSLYKFLIVTKKGEIKND